jgi:hypothetical protein
LESYGELELRGAGATGSWSFGETSSGTRGTRGTRGTLGEHGATVWETSLGVRVTRGTRGTLGETSLGARVARGNQGTLWCDSFNWDNSGRTGKHYQYRGTGSTGVLGTRGTIKAATIGGVAVRRIEDPKILKNSETWLKTLKTSAEDTGAQEDTPGDA